MEFQKMNSRNSFEFIFWWNERWKAAKMDEEVESSPLKKFFKRLNDQVKNEVTFDSIVTTNKELLVSFVFP